ncbi:MAG: hypothetical protein OEZ39_05940 [Gammaproteobacteria bacterium]|nr:hypothetical protein [Gammaproteobacteria bacterium]MDH5651395.1 hypothetical protein [Gammaproteobacteria bacterium]
MYIFLLLPGIASSDEYLDALKDEAGELEYLDESRSGNVKHAQKKDVNNEIIKAAENISSFEQYYKQQDAAGAAIYLRLKTADRIRIFRRFKTTKNFEIARKMTFDLYQKK